jgi:hypothetical protein
MRVTQLVDSPMAYRKFVTRIPAEQATAQSNCDKVARAISGRGAAGLVICPKELRLAWERGKSLPPGWMVWNFGAIRGRDEAREVPQLVIVSRPLPSPAEAEIMPETIFERRVERLPTGEWYPKAPVGRLMADGTGRRALALRHTDPLVEAVRFAVCEGELLQAVGRGRGVRRTAATPLDVLILTDVPTPIPVDALTTWKELRDTGPLELLAAKGVVPLDYAGIVAALPGLFKSAAQLKDWLKRRPHVRSQLRGIKQMARDAGTLDCEFRELSHRESYMGNLPKLAAYT